MVNLQLTVVLTVRTVAGRFFSLHHLEHIYEEV